MSARQLITEHLDLWTGAVTKKSSSGRGNNGKVELTGIKKLRELILQLAVTGQLVEQDTEDEPASGLLESIDDEIESLIKQGNIKAPKRAPAVEDSDKAFAIPESWQWVRLGSLALHSEAGWSPRCHDRPRENENWGVLKVSAVTWGEFLPNENKELPSSLTPRPEYEVRPSDFLISRANTAELVARSVVVPEGAPRKLMMSDKIIRFVFSEHVDPLYLNLFNNCSYARAYYLSVAGGTSSSMKNVSRAQIQTLPLPLPPRAEQHRIVQKVDELMALCDRLEQQTSDQLEAHETLVDTLLGTLTQSENATELADNWARLAAHFDTLFTTEQSIDKLKQSILQLAVMGRLVEQDAEGESTSRLFDRVYSENGDKRSRLLDRSQTSCDSHLPPGWDYAVLPEVTENKKYSLKRGPFGSALKKAFFKANGFKVYEQQHAINNDFSRGEYYIDEDKFTELKAFEVKPGDLIISCSGTVGRVAEAPTWMEPGIINQALLKLSLDQRLLTNDYFKILFPAFFLETDTLQNLQGTAQKNMVSMDTLKKEAFPMPPLEEQQRIVQKVDELIALCDQLKERLSQASETRCQLAEAIVEQGLSA